MLSIIIIVIVVIVVITVIIAIVVIIVGILIITLGELISQSSSLTICRCGEPQGTEKLKEWPHDNIRIL